MARTLASLPLTRLCVLAALLTGAGIAGCVTDNAASLRDTDTDGAAGGVRADARTDALTGGALGDAVSRSDVRPVGDAVVPADAFAADATAPADLGAPGDLRVKPEPDAAPGPCDPLCAHVVDCAAQLCGDDAAAAAVAIRLDCLQACQADPHFAEAGGAIEGCPETVAFARLAMGPDFSALCDPATVPDPTYPVCDVWGARLAACMAEACPNLDALQAQTAATYTFYCNRGVTNGDVDPDGLAAVLSPNTPCDTPFIANLVAQQTGPGSDLAPFCAEGPASDAATCEAACQALGPCLTPGQDGAELSNPDYCQYLCAVSRNPEPAVWSCLADHQGAECGPVLQCFQPPLPPESPLCPTYAARIAACTVESCPRVSTYADGLNTFVRLFCNQAVESDARAAAVIATVTADTPCDARAIAPLVVGLTQDDPNNDQDGRLARYCADGAAITPDACATACQRLTPCIPEGSSGASLRDVGYCDFFCGTEQPEISADRWACIGAAPPDVCDPVLACFAN